MPLAAHYGLLESFSFVFDTWSSMSALDNTFLDVFLTTNFDSQATAISNAASSVATLYCALVMKLGASKAANAAPIFVTAWTSMASAEVICVKSNKYRVSKVVLCENFKEVNAKLEEAEKAIKKLCEILDEEDFEKIVKDQFERLRINDWQ